jgi:hypothetical protein
MIRGIHVSVNEMISRPTLPSPSLRFPPLDLFSLTCLHQISDSRLCLLVWLVQPTPLLLSAQLQQVRQHIFEVATHLDRSAGEMRGGEHVRGRRSKKRSGRRRGRSGGNREGTRCGELGVRWDGEKRGEKEDERSE